MSNDDIFISAREQAKQVRAKCPSAYALTVNEAIRINRVDMIVWQFFDSHPKYVKEQEVGISQTGEPIMKRVNVYDEESIGLIKEQLRRRRINLDNTIAIADRVLSGRWFDVIGILNLSGDPDKGLMGVYVDGKYEGAISREVYPSFYEIFEAEGYGNAEALRQALRLDNDYKLLCPGELNTLKLIRYISEGETEQVNILEGYMAIKSSPETTALANIGTTAISQAQYDELNEMFRILSSTGVSLTLDGEMLKPTRFISLDKLWRQINSVAYNTHYTSKVIKISLDDYMRLRRLKSRKDARKQLKEDNDDFPHLLMRGNGTDRGFRIVEQLPYIKNSEAVYYLTDAAFILLSSKSSSVQYQPEYLMSLTGNAYMIGTFIEDHIRRNIGNANEMRISIMRLLESTNLPLASEVQPKHYKLRIIDPFFANLSKVAQGGGFSYKVVRSGGAPLSTGEETEVHYDYNLFASCLIEIHKESEPEYYTQLRQQKLIEAEARGRGRLKGIESAAKKQAEAKAMGKPVKKR